MYGKVDNVESQSGYSAFSSRYLPVCAGYSRASEILFNNIGITSYLVYGTLSNSWFSGGGRHEWNIVRVDGRYYYYDVTQSSVNKSKVEDESSYIGLLNKDISGYNLHFKKSSPIINGRKYDYYDYNNLTVKYDKKNLSNLKDIIKKATTNIVEVRMSNGSSFVRDFNNIKEELGLSSVSYSGDIYFLKRTK